MKYRTKYTLKTWLIQMLKNLLKDEHSPEQIQKINIEIGKLNAK